MCLDLIFWFVRILNLFAAFQKLGPKLIMIFNTMKDLFFFVCFILIFLLAFSIASWSLITTHDQVDWYYNSNGSLFNVTVSGQGSNLWTWYTIRHVINYGVWKIFGQVESFSQDRIDAYSNVAFVLDILFVAISNVLLLSVLVALFNVTIQYVEEQSNQIWGYQRYLLVTEYSVKSPLPPPFHTVPNLYHIVRSVLPPDEDAQPFKNNSIYTNAIASLSIQLAHNVSCITNKTIPSKWLDIAYNLYFPFDNSTKTYLEYEDFDLKHTTIKQADVVLFGLPLMWPMNDEVRQNDLLAYEPLTHADGAAMTWSIYSIGFTELGDLDKADQLFRRSYESYARPPFNTETQSGVGAVNFITGVGDFLQAVLFGYGGIRLKLSELEFKPHGHLPGQATKLIFHGIKYQGFVLDLTIDNKIYEIFVSSQNNNNSISLIYEHEDHHGLLEVNDRLSFSIDTHLIIRQSVALCP
ncbi:unnamed protein product [Rotaria sp. Silwood1]|nr:unnamed protein product [Rotaria sp. Silwood1]CAF4833009.1 unnamed protein product [Rotaria sp. Silwood1]